MIQKRSNPLEKKEDEQEEVKPVAKKPVAQKPKKVSAPAPLQKQEENLAPIQKRVNPLVLEALSTTQSPAPAIKPTEPKIQPKAEKEQKLPKEIIGKAKKSFVITSVNKALYKALQSATGNKSGKLLDDAMLCMLAVNFPDELKKVKEILKQEGCEIK